MEDKSAVLVRCVSKEYKIGNATVRALVDFSLTVAESEFVSVEGPSGAGKTTLLNIVGGIEKPTSGQVSVFRQELTKCDEGYLAVFRCANVGFVFQSYNLISTLTMAENIAFPMELAGWPGGRIEKRTKELLRLFGLPHRANHFPSQISGGEQQRAAFARALANNPPLILVDEPTANLDLKTGEIIVDLLNQLKQQEKTLLVATHDERILALSDRTVHLREGKLSRP